MLIKTSLRLKTTSCAVLLANYRSKQKESSPIPLSRCMYVHHRKQLLPSSPLMCSFPDFPLNRLLVYFLRGLDWLHSLFAGARNKRNRRKTDFPEQGL
jgi:hypothetical protein